MENKDTSIRINRKTYKKLRIMAAQKDMSIKALVAELVKKKSTQ